MKIRAALFLALLLAALSACHEPEPVSPPVGLTSAIQPPKFPGLGNYPEREITLHLYLTENLRHVCSGPDPFFHFDSDRISAKDQPGLYALAACMKTGPLKDQSIVLTGRADPRGGMDYNDKLGLERAERVKAFLVRQGIDSSRVVTASLGKSGAAPDREAWPTDRRVDIDLVH